MYYPDRYAVRLLKDGESWESLTFSVPKEHIIGVHEKLWPFLAAVNSSFERVNVAKDKNRCEKLMQLGTEMVVGFKDVSGAYLGTIKYIGHVKGIGKCFGIKLHVSVFFLNCMYSFLYTCRHSSTTDNIVFVIIILLGMWSHFITSVIHFITYL